MQNTTQCTFPVLKQQLEKNAYDYLSMLDAESCVSQPWSRCSNAFVSYKPPSKCNSSILTCFRYNVQFAGQLKSQRKLPYTLTHIPHFLLTLQCIFTMNKDIHYHSHSAIAQFRKFNANEIIFMTISCTLRSILQF